MERKSTRRASSSFDATQVFPSQKSPFALRKMNTENLDSECSRKYNPENHWAFPEDLQVSNLSVTNNDNIMTIKKRLNLMNLLKDKMNQLQISEGDRKWFSLYKRLRHLRFIAMMSYVFLGFFHKPYWCLKDRHLYSPDCAIKLTTPAQNLFLSNLPQIDPLYYALAQFFLMLFLTMNKAMRFKFYKKSQTRRFRFAFYIISLVLAFMQTMFDPVVTINDMLKPVFLICYYRYLRTGWLTYMGYIYSALPIFFLSFLNIGIFTLLGKMVSYEDYKQKSFGELFFQLFVLQTTCNFPDIMMTDYRKNRLSFLFYFFFLLINNIILVNMIIGVSYMNYKVYLQKHSCSFENTPQLQAILDAYIDQSDYKNHMITSQLNEYVLGSECSDSQHIKAKQNVESPLVSQDPESSSNTSIARSFYILYLAMSVISTTSLLLLFIDYYQFSEIDKQKLHSEIDVTEQSFLIGQCVIHSLVLVESSLRILFSSRITYRYHPYLNGFECIQTLIFLLLAILYSTDYLNYHLINLWCLLRLVRFVRAILEIAWVSLILKAIYNIVPQFFDHLSILFCIYLFFSSLGIFLFGGTLTDSLPYKENDLPPSYALNNFNDLMSSFVVCFELMIVNNWQVTTQVHLIFSHNYAQLYFVLFYIVSVTFGINIIIAIIIEWISQTLTYVRSQQEKKKTL